MTRNTLDTAAGNTNQINSKKYTRSTSKKSLDVRGRTPGICTVGIENLLPSTSHSDVLLVGGRCLVTDLGTALPIAAGAPKGFAAHRPCAADARGGVHALCMCYVPVLVLAQRPLLCAADLGLLPTGERVAGLRGITDLVLIEWTLLVVAAARLPSSGVVLLRATALHLRTRQTPTPRACVCLITDFVVVRTAALLRAVVKLAPPTALSRRVVQLNAAAAVAGVGGHIAGTLARAALCLVVVSLIIAALREGVRRHATAPNADLAAIRRLAASTAAPLAFAVAVDLYVLAGACAAVWLLRGTGVFYVHILATCTDLGRLIKAQSDGKAVAHTAIQT